MKRDDEPTTNEKWLFESKQSSTLFSLKRVHNSDYKDWTTDAEWGANILSNSRTTLWVVVVVCLCFALIVPPKMLQCSSQSTVKLRRDNQEKQKGVNNNRIDRLNKEWKTTNYEDLQRNRTHEYKEWKKRTKQRRLPKEMMNFSIFYLKKLQRIHREFPVMKD